MSWEPLPIGEGANPLLRRLKAIDAEIYGNIYAQSGTIGGDVTIEGTLVGNDIYSSNWNGATPANLSSVDSTASAGYYFDGSVGAAQFEGNLYLQGDLQMGGSGNILTNASGQYRAELGTTGLYFKNTSNTTIASLQSTSSGFQISGDTIINDELALWGAGGSGEESARFEFIAGNSGTSEWIDLKFADDWNAGEGILRMHASGAGSTGITPNFYAKSFMFLDETTTGFSRPGASQVELKISGTREILIGSTGFKVPNVYNSTDPTAANVFVNTDGGLYRSTSSKRYKVAITDAGFLANVSLYPVGFRSRINNKYYYGLIAEDVAEEVPEAAIVGEDGQVEDYDTRAVIAVLVAKVNRLEERLAGHGVHLDGS